jgi:hypothetical protein
LLKIARAWRECAKDRSSGASISRFAVAVSRFGFAVGTRLAEIAVGTRLAETKLRVEIYAKLLSGACRRIQAIPMQMRSCFGALILSLVASGACANVLISVDKNTQQMTVSVDGAPRYQFAVSTGRAGYGTPNGAYHPQRLERTWFSKEYYNSPMPHSIFFHGGYAIHGSYEINRLGGPASHGCIRLHPQNAATLFALVKQQGVGATTIVVSGQNPGVARRHR